MKAALVVSWSGVKAGFERILEDFSYQYAIVGESADEQAELYLAVGGELGLF